jgi:hypothetical protein
VYPTQYQLVPPLAVSQSSGTVPLNTSGYAQTLVQLDPIHQAADSSGGSLSQRQVSGDAGIFSADQDGEMSIEVGSSVVQTVIQDPNLLRQLTAVLKGVNGKFKWRQPDHILVKCTAKPVPASWIEEVQLEVRRFLLQLKRKHANEERVSDWSWRQPAPEKFSEDSSDKDKPDSDIAEDSIPNLNPAQLKALSIPSSMEKLRKQYKGLRIVVDEKSKTARVCCLKKDLNRAYFDVLVILNSFKEMRVALSPAVIQMFQKSDAKKWIQEKVVEGNQLVCHWEVSVDGKLVLCAQVRDLQSNEQLFKDVFTEKSINLNDEELKVLKTPMYWNNFQKEMETERGGLCPTPVLLLEGQKVVIVDTPYNIGGTQRKLMDFLETQRWVSSALADYYRKR